MGRVTLSASLLLVVCAAATEVAADEQQLIQAVKRHDLAEVQAALKGGANVNAQQPDGATPLHWAAYQDDVAIAGVLARAGANAKIANELGITPLHLACLNGSAAMAALLLKAGADPNGGPAGDETPVMTAARTGNPDVMKLLLASGGTATAKEAVRDQTALMWAAGQRHAEVVRVLVNHGADVRARTKVPPPKPAAEQRPGGGAAAANPGLAQPPTGNGFTALLFAARVGDIESARILLEAGADMNDASADGMSALVLSTVRGFPEFATFLLDKGADPNLDGAGYTALHWAAGTWESELTVRAITTEREGEWLTVAGLKAGKLGLVKALLAHGANPNAVMKKAPARAGSSKNPGLSELEGATPLILAAMAGDVEVMRALVTAGANRQLRTKAAGTVLMAAAGLGHVQGENLVTDGDARAAAEAALAMGADPNAVDAVGNTALHYAAYMRQDGVVQLLANHGAALEAKNKFGETPLWTSELVVQFSGGGTFQLLRSTTSDLLRKLGAVDTKPTYTRSRPTEWPDNPRGAADQVGVPQNSKPEPPQKEKQ